MRRNLDATGERSGEMSDKLTLLLCIVVAYIVGFSVQFLDGPGWASFLGFTITFILLEMRFCGDEK